jgi:tetratricopeptide (TPR) repeat protein
MFEQVQKTLPQTITRHKKDLPILTLDGCQDRLVYTAFERYHNAGYVLTDLINKPPFTSQSYHADLVKALENEVDNLKQGIIRDAREIVALYNKTIIRHPQDWRLRWKRALFYSQDPAQYQYISMELKRILQELPLDEAYVGLMPILILQNKLDEAEYCCRELIKMRPTSVISYSYLGNIFRKKGDYRKAIKYFSIAIDLQPMEAVSAYRDLADVFEGRGNPEKAIKVLYKAIDNLPKDQTAMDHINLGLLLGKENRPKEAIQVLCTAIHDFPPEEIKKENDVFVLLLKLDQIQLAIELYHQVLKVQPNSLATLNDLAWILATCDDKTLRNPKEAVQLAEKACNLTNYTSARAMDTLAAAYASSGDFERAVITAKKAVKAANEMGQTDQAVKITNKLRLYEKGLPYVEKIKP